MTLRSLAAALALAAIGLAVGLYLSHRPPLSPAPGRGVLPLTHDGPVIAAPDGHAYQYVAAPDIAWDAARVAAARRSWHGQRGYLATLGSEAEYRFVLDHVFANAYSDVTYLGGRQTAPGEWRWVTGPDAAADGGRGRVFWKGGEQGAAVDGAYANWMSSAFQHGGAWDMKKVCCVTLFSYGMPQFSTSLGNGDWREGVAGYLVEYGG
jgi:hypothetical protein